MSENQAEKTEQPTPRRLEEAVKHGQIARSSEVQTVFVFSAVLLALTFTGHETWRVMIHAMAGILGHLHQVPFSFNLLPGYAINSVLVIAQCAGPVALAAVLGGLLAGSMQNRFQTASEALSPNWDRVNPAEGFKRVFSMKAAVPSLISLAKLAAIILLSYSTVETILRDPIFYTSVDVARIAGFMAESSFKIFLRVIMIMVVIAGVDYAYQSWRNSQELMMTKDELKEEAKNSETNANIKARQRKRRQQISMRQMLAEVPKADVVVTNPTHFAVAIRYDSKQMKAPRVVAKGARLHAQRIKEIARQHQVPITENKPLARLLFKHCRVGGEVPAQVYVAVAEVLAWVYRANRYRYYAKANQIQNG
jgi:flagellar biosynthesis protein FlhB